MAKGVYVLWWALVGCTVALDFPVFTSKRYVLQKNVGIYSQPNDVNHRVHYYFVDTRTGVQVCWFYVNRRGMWKSLPIEYDAVDTEDYIKHNLPDELHVRVHGYVIVMRFVAGKVDKCGWETVDDWQPGVPLGHTDDTAFLSRCNEAMAQGTVMRLFRALQQGYADTYTEAAMALVGQLAL